MVIVTLFNSLLFYYKDAEEGTTSCGPSSGLEFIFKNNGKLFMNLIRRLKFTESD